MGVEENLNKRLYKTLLLLLKYIPIITGIMYIVNTVLSYFYIDIPAISSLVGISLSTWIFMYISAIVFKFCIYHKMFLHYILIVDILNIIDLYIGIPLDNLELLMLHMILLGLFLVLILGLYVKTYKATTFKNNR